METPGTEGVAPILLSEEQKAALRSVAAGYNTFITGGGGVGKSQLTHMIIFWMRKMYTEH